jgi:hypothetical protein
VNPGQISAQGEALVHVESCVPGSSDFRGYVGNGAGFCPFVPGDYTFYGRFAPIAGQDQREPLATTFATKYQGPAKTDLLVWRDPKTTTSGNNGKRTCGLSPAWYPLADTDVVAFDTAENPTDECALASNTSPASANTCFPLATQRVNLKNGNALAAKIKPPANAGWLFMNLSHSISGDPFPGVAQAWVASVRTSSDGRLSSGASSIQLDNALTPNQAGPGALIP